MNPVFKPDPVLVQKGRVLAAFKSWKDARRQVNSADDLPERLDDLLAIAARIADPVRSDVAIDLAALIVEFEGLVFSGEPDDEMRGVEEKTLIVQAALGNLRTAATKAGYETDGAEDSGLPIGVRIPAQALADKLDALADDIRDLKQGVQKIADAQVADEENNTPPVQAPLVQNFVERANIKLEFSLIKISGKLIDVTGLARILQDARKLVTDFLGTVSHIVLRATHWLKAKATAWLKPASEKLGAARTALVKLAASWFRSRAKPDSGSGKEADKEPPSAPPPGTPPIVDPGEPPADFDMDEVRAMILRGEAPPASWVPWITRLGFDGSDISDLKPISNLTALQRLTLDNTQVTDLKPISSLTALQRLTLDNTQVTDLKPISSLTALQTLWLNNTQVTDLKPISSLTALQELWLNNTQVTDLKPISSLTALQRLTLDNTQVTDLKPISSLTALQELWLNNTQVTDLKPISSLTALQELCLNNTQVTDLKPISSLTALQRLWLNNTQVTDLKPISSLTALQRLTLDNTQVTDLKPISSLTALQRLYLNNTQVADLKPISSLTALQRLTLDNTQVADLKPISSLTALQTLDLDNTQVADLKPLKSLDSLKDIYVERGRVAKLTATLGRSGVVKLAPWLKPKRKARATPPNAKPRKRRGSTIPSLRA